MNISQLLETHLVLSDALAVVREIRYSPDQYRHIIDLHSKKKANLASIQASRCNRLKRFSDSQLALRLAKLYKTNPHDPETSLIEIEQEIRGVIKS